MPKHDSKDPAPSADNSQRKGGGNEPYPKGAEGHGDGRAEYVKADARYSLRSGGESQPGRQDGDGNVPAKGEKHDQKKAERVPEDRRW